MSKKYFSLIVFNIFLAFFLGTINAQTKNVPLGSGGYGSSNILGGTSTNINQAPYQISMESNGSHICGGSIISNRWILSAAHCLVGASANSITIHAGSTDQTNNSVGQRIVAQTIYVHPNYNSTTLENDVALIYLSQPLIFNHDVCPIEYANNCNTTTTSISPPRSTFLTGWGITCNTCSGSTTLNGVNLPIIDNTTARNINIAYNSSYNTNISNNMISFFNAGQGAGPGDSGGPAVIDNNGNKIEIGTSSWGWWPKDQLPTIYANIRNYGTWIQNTTGLTISKPSSVDLYIKDKPWDMGFEPSGNPGGNYNTWESEDIWVRQQNDGITNQVHQNAEYYTTSGYYNYIYVRVRNRGCVASNGTEKLRLYWGKAATNLSWPKPWDGTVSVNGQPMGGLIGEVTLPIVEPGNATIAVFQWLPPNPANYEGINDEPQHFCVLARKLSSTADPITFTETTSLGDNVLKNNNIAWKNFSVVDLNTKMASAGGSTVVLGGTGTGGGLGGFGGTDTTKKKTGATVTVGGKYGKLIGKYKFLFDNPKYFVGRSVIQEAEIKVTLNQFVWNKWKAGGSKSENIAILNEENRELKITGLPASISNIEFADGELGLLNTNFNFLTKEYSGQSKFELDVQQIDEDDNSVMGGELYKIELPSREQFVAHAGSDKTLNPTESTTLIALDINEPAIYNWYNEEGELIYTGKEITISPELNEKLKLEVIALKDGFKDYDEVKIDVKNNFISNLYPNPASSVLNIDYYVKDATSAYLSIIKHNGNISNQYVLNTTLTSKQVNLDNYENGLYTVILISNGQIKDFKTLSVEK